MKTLEVTKRKVERNPNRTRKTILYAAFRDIHLNGFGGASLDNILSAADLTKGALYHHFPNKIALGYAVVDEILLPAFKRKWGAVSDCDDPIDFLQRIIKQTSESITPDQILLGCPLNNLMQEMSPIDEGFRIKLYNVYQYWFMAIADALRKGQKERSVRADCDPDQVAAFIVASIEGSFGTAKNSQNIGMLRSCLAELNTYLNRLRAKV